MDKELIEEILAYVEQTVEIIDEDRDRGIGNFEVLKKANSGLIPEFYYTLKEEKMRSKKGEIEFEQKSKDSIRLYEERQF